MNDTYISFIWLPSRVHAITVPDADGNYIVFVNQNLCFNQQEKAIKHELEHIKNGDFENFADVEYLEEIVKSNLG